MSYTAPQYVDTKEQAVLALASVIADEDKTALGNGSVNRALDVLADVLAAQDVQVPQTNAGAILALAQYVGGGGGGAQTLDVNLWNYTESEDESLKDVLPVEVRYITGFSSGNPVLSDPLPFEHITGEASDTTFHGVRVSGLPMGAYVELTFNDEQIFVDYLYFGLTESGAADEQLVAKGQFIVLAPVGGLVVTSQYELYENV